MDGLLFPFPHPDPLTASDTIFPIHGMLSSTSFEDSLSWFSSHLSLGCLVSFAGSSFPYQWEFSRVPAPASALPPLLLSLVTFISSGSTATFVPPSDLAELPVSSTCPKCTYAGFLVPPSLNPLCPNKAVNAARKPSPTLTFLTAVHGFLMTWWPSWETSAQLPPSPSPPTSIPSIPDSFNLMGELPGLRDSREIAE